MSLTVRIALSVASAASVILTFWWSVRAGVSRHQDPAQAPRDTDTHQYWGYTSFLFACVTVWAVTRDVNWKLVVIAYLSVTVYSLVTALWGLWWVRRGAIDAARAWQAKAPRPSFDEEPDLHRLWAHVERDAYRCQGRCLFDIERVYAFDDHDTAEAMLFLEEREGKLVNVHEHANRVRATEAARNKCRTMGNIEKKDIIERCRALRRIFDSRTPFS